MDVGKLKDDVRAGRVGTDQLLELLETLVRRVAELERKLGERDGEKVEQPFSLRAEEKRQEQRGRVRRSRKRPGRRGRLTNAEKIKHAEAIVELKAKFFQQEQENDLMRVTKVLTGSKWVWPDENLRPKNYFVLQADGTVLAGWHRSGGRWTVKTPTTIEAVIAASDRTPKILAIDFQRAVMKSADGKIYRRIK